LSIARIAFLLAQEILNQREVRDKVGGAIAQRHSAVTVDLD